MPKPNQNKTKTYTQTDLIARREQKSQQQNQQSKLNRKSYIYMQTRHVCFVLYDISSGYSHVNGF